MTCRRSTVDSAVWLFDEAGSVRDIRLLWCSGERLSCGLLAAWFSWSPIFRESLPYASLRVKILTLEVGIDTLFQNLKILTLEVGIDTFFQNLKILTLEVGIDTLFQNLKILTLEVGIDTLFQNLKILTLEVGIDTLFQNLKILTLEVGIDTLSRNVGTNQPTLCSNPKEQKSEGASRGNILEL